jgi:hypothetical protein
LADVRLQQAGVAIASRAAGAAISGTALGASIGSIIPGFGTLVGAVIGTLAGKLLPTGASRRTSITSERVLGNRFAAGCTAQGVGSTVCPVGTLRTWAALAQQKYPNAYRTVWAPLLAGAPRTSVSQLDQMLRTYVSHRKLIPTSAVQITPTGFKIGSPTATLSAPARAALSVGGYRPAFALRL